MNKLKIPHDAFVFVGDGRKAIFLRNEGDEKFPNLKTEKVIEDDDNPPTHEQGTDKPGALGKAMGSGRRSAVEPADWHDLNEHRFARTVAGAIEQVMRERKVPALVIVAPPRTLADLRNALHADVAARVIAEVNKDLTRHPVNEIEKHLTGGCCRDRANQRRGRRAAPELTRAAVRTPRPNGRTGRAPLRDSR